MSLNEDMLSLDNIKDALERMHDALGIHYTDFSDVMETLDDMRVDLKPTKETMTMISDFKKRSSDTSGSMNPAEFWHEKAMELDSVLECMRLYLEANGEMFPGCSVIKSRILFLANKGRWR